MGLLLPRNVEDKDSLEYHNRLDIVKPGEKCSTHSPSLVFVLMTLYYYTSTFVWKSAAAALCSSNLDYVMMLLSSH